MFCLSIIVSSGKCRIGSSERTEQRQRRVLPGVHPKRSFHIGEPDASN